MKIEELKKSGGFVDSKLEDRSGEWTHDGQTDEIQFKVKRLSFGDIDRALSLEGMSKSAELIRLGIRLGDKGEEQLTYDQAYRLHGGLAGVFADAVLDINGVADNGVADNGPLDKTGSSGQKSAGTSGRQSKKAKSG